MDIYEVCPEFCSERFLLRQVRREDCADLLEVYSDTAAVPIFNSDNCTGDFYITTPEDMMNCIDFWLREYGQRYYIRWSIIDRAAGAAVGTIELFHRTAQDFFDHVGLLRLDLRSDYENNDAITDLLTLLLPSAFGLFGCDTMATKIPPCAPVRRAALSALGFQASTELLYGHDGTGYGDYYILKKDDLPLL